MRRFVTNNWIYFVKQRLNLDAYSKQKRFTIVRRRGIFYKVDKKLYKSINLYPTDFRKKILTTEKLLCNFFMKGGRFFKVLANLRKAQALFLNSMIFEVPEFLKRKYSFFETLGQIIFFNSSQWLNFNTLLSYFFKKSESIFYFSVESLRNQYKKKKKVLRLENFRVTLKSLAVHKRRNRNIREFNLYVNSIKKRRFGDRLAMALMNLFLLDKQNYLYLRKVHCYKQALNRYFTSLNGIGRRPKSK